MDRIVLSALALGTFLIAAAPAPAAAKHVKSHCPESRVIVPKAPILWPGADRYAPATPRHCEWIGPGARATYTCR